MYLPITRWQRPRWAHAGAKCGSSSSAALVQVARPRESVVGARQLVRSKVELVGAGVVRRVGRGRRRSTAQRQRQRLHDAPRDVVLQPEQVAQRRLDRVRGEQRTAGGLDELRRGSNLVAGAQQRSHDHPVDVGLRRESFEIRRLAGEARGGGAGAHDQRADAGQRRRDGVRQAEGQEVGFGIGAQHAERQHDEARERAGQHRRVVAVHAERRAAPRPSRRPTPVGPRAAWPARGGSRDRPRRQPASR